jgi:hypothetical protein
VVECSRVKDDDEVRLGTKINGGLYREESSTTMTCIFRLVDKG